MRLGIQPHLFEDCAVAAWSAWRVVVKAQEIERHSQLYPYERVRSDLFYAKVLASIGASTHCTLLKGVSAGTCTSSDTGVRVALSDGSTAVGSWAIDTRPKPLAVKKPWLWQHFLGFVLHFEDDEPSLANIPTLMEFQTAGSCVAQFMYVLPLGSEEFLCEWTQFSSKPLIMPELEVALLNWLGQHAPAGGKLRRRESVSPHGTHCPAGTGQGHRGRDARRQHACVLGVRLLCHPALERTLRSVARRHWQARPTGT